MEQNKTNDRIKKWCWILIILICIFLFPYIINRLILSERYWDVVGEDKDWLQFWPSYLSAIASAVMIGYTATTLKNNQKQLDVLKRQWDDEHKPNITVSYNMIDNVAYLRLVNTSKTEITNLSIKGEFYERENINEFFNMSILENYVINIEPHGIRNIVLHNDIAPLSNDFYFKLSLSYNETEHKDVKVYCNDVYSVGDDIVWRKLIESIKRIKK